MGTIADPIKVSVVIAVYNGVRYIEYALDSIFAQSLQPIEIIVVDDGSTDETASVIANYKFTERRLENYLTLVKRIKPGAVDGLPELTLREIKIILLRQQNRGPSAARNLGIKQATGEWIAFLDGDDLWLPNCLGTLAASLKIHPTAGVFCGGAINFQESNGTIQSKPGPLVQAESKRDALIRLLRTNFMLTGAVLVKRLNLIKAKGFDESLRYVEDADIWLRLLLECDYGGTREVVLLRRIHDNSSSINQEKFYQAAVLVLNRFYRQNTEKLKELCIDAKFAPRWALWQLAYFYYCNGFRVKAAVSCIHAIAKDPALRGWRWGCKSNSIQ